MASRQGEVNGNINAGIGQATAVNPAGGDVVLARVSRAIYVGASGNLTVQFAGDADAATVQLVGLAAGVWHPMQVQKILQSGATATGVVVGY